MLYVFSPNSEFSRFFIFILDQVFYFLFLFFIAIDVFSFLQDSTLNENLSSGRDIYNVRTLTFGS